jgi:hypothetical protein
LPVTANRLAFRAKRKSCGEQLPYTAYIQIQRGGTCELFHTKIKASLYFRTAILASALVLSGCNSYISSAGDLVRWVKAQAIEEGCQQGTIVLDQWYTQTDKGNVWRGTCKGADGKKRYFSINVDSVWKTSEQK